MTWPNGATVTLFSAEEPDRLRGPQFDAAYVDELAAWDKQESWDMLQFSLRLGSDPRVVITTTPRPIKIIRDFFQDEDCHITRGSTLDNSENLATQFVDQIIKRYEGTRLYSQEIQGNILENVEGAILSAASLDALRVRGEQDVVRVVVGVDPAATAHSSSDLTGISVSAKGADGHLYSIADRSCRMTPEGWAGRVAEAYYHYGASLVVAEGNNGGDMVRAVLKSVDPNIPVKMVSAVKSKQARAMPILLLHEQGRAHVVGVQEDLEKQLCCFTHEGYDGEGSPDNADAYVWAATELMLGSTTSWSDVAGANV